MKDLQKFLKSGAARFDSSREMSTTPPKTHRRHRLRPHKHPRRRQVYQPQPRPRRIPIEENIITIRSHHRSKEAHMYDQPIPLPPPNPKLDHSATSVMDAMTVKVATGSYEPFVQVRHQASKQASTLNAYSRPPPSSTMHTSELYKADRKVLTDVLAVAGIAEGDRGVER